MKKVYFEEEKKAIDFNDIDFDCQAVFAKKKGKLVGMLVNENSGWIVRIGGLGGASGHHRTAKKCIKDASSCCEYEFFVE